MMGACMQGRPATSSCFPPAARHHPTAGELRPFWRATEPRADMQRAMRVAQGRWMRGRSRRAPARLAAPRSPAGPAAALRHPYEAYVRDRAARQRAGAKCARVLAAAPASLPAVRRADVDVGAPAISARDDADVGAAKLVMAPEHSMTPRGSKSESVVRAEPSPAISITRPRAAAVDAGARRLMLSNAGRCRPTHASNRAMQAQRDVPGPGISCRPARTEKAACSAGRR